MIKWEIELSKSIPLSQWLRAFKANASSSSCVNHWDNAQKILHRYYMTPHRLHQIDSTLSPLCWRGCGETGNLIHVFWSCPAIQPLWKEISSLISKMVGNDYEITSALALLSISIEDFPMTDRTPISHLFFATRMVVAKKWRSLTPPTLGETIHTVNFQFVVETMLAYKELKAAIFQNKWRKWLVISPDVD